MKREVFEVHMTVIDANGTVTINPSGYPKKVDSMSYDNDIQKALMRAQGLLGSAEYDMSTKDTRQKQFAYIIRCSDGVQIEKRDFGAIADLPDPEPEPEPEPEEPETPETPETPEEGDGE